MTCDILEFEPAVRCQYLRWWRMGQNFKLHTPWFCQYPAPTRRAVSQPAAALWQKIQKAPLSEACQWVGQNVQVLFGAWTYFSGVTGYASHSVTCGVGQVIRPPFHMSHFPVRRHGASPQLLPFGRIWTKDQSPTGSAFNHLNTSDWLHDWFRGS